MSLLSQGRRVFVAGWKHRWKALAVSYLVCGLGWIGVQLIPNQYQSNARVYADADAILGSILRGIAIETSPANSVETLQRSLLSRPNLARVISQTDLALRAPTRDQQEVLMQRLERDIRITPQTRNLFAIEYRDTNPRIARDVVQTTIELFLEAASGNDRRQTENARNFLAQQIASYEVQLREAERRRAEFQSRYVDLLPSEQLGGASRLEAARTRLVQLRGELNDARVRTTIIQRQLGSLPAAPSVVYGGGGGGGDTRLAEAERQLRELRLRLTDQHPDVVSQRAVIAALRASGNGGGPATAAQARAPSGPAPARAAAAPRDSLLLEQLRIRQVDAEASVASLERQERDAVAEVERLDALARSEPEVRAQFINIDRDYNVLRRNYEELLARRESLSIGDAARTSQDRVKFEVIEPPVMANVPASPNRKLFAALVLVAGCGAGAALALLLATLDKGFYTLADLRAIGLPILGAISAPPRPAAAGAVLAFAGGAGLLLVLFVAVLAGAPRLVVGLFA